MTGDDFLSEADLIKAAEDHVAASIDEKAKVALDGLSAKLLAAAREAHAQGLDFAHGPVQIAGPDPFAISNIFAPQMMTATVQGGPVEPGLDWPHDWTVYRCPAESPDAH